MQLGAYLEEDERTTKRMIDINVYGVHYGSTIALERFVTRGRGHLVNIASMAGKAGYASAPRTAAPSTTSSASARRCAARCATPTSRSRS